MAGALILVVVMVIVGPFALFVGGMAWSALQGQALSRYRNPEEGDPGKVDG